MGYQKFQDKKLMLNFAGKPFIDVRKSLNSLLPKGANNLIGKKLVDHSISKLKSFPSLHDKVEFELMPTCFSFSIKEKLKKININSITHYRFLEKNFTEMFINNLSPKSLGSIENNLKKIEILKYRQDNELYYLNSSLKNINKIINETKNYGIVPLQYLLDTVL